MCLGVGLVLQALPRLVQGELPRWSYHCVVIHGLDLPCGDGGGD